MANKNIKPESALMQMLQPYRLRIALLCACSVCASLLQVFSALVIRNLVDTAVSGAQKMFLWGGILLTVLTALVTLYVLQSWLAGSTADYSMAMLRRSLLEDAAASEDARMLGYHSGKLLNRGMEDVRTVCDGMVSTLPTMCGQITRLVASFTAVLLLYRPVTGIITLAALFAAVMATVLRPYIKKQHSLVRKADERLMVEMQEDLRQLELVKSIGVEQQMLSRFDKQINASLKAKRQRRFWTVGSNGMLSAFSQIGTGAMLLWGAAQVATGSLSYGALTAMLQLLNQFRSPVLGLSGLWTKLTAVEVAGERLYETLSPKLSTGVQPIDVGSIAAVVFENVTFTYPDDTVPVIKHFSAEFPLDNWTCITGVSGKGKSTLFKLMLGLYTPQEGKVFLRTDRGNISCGVETRHLFAYVPQDFALFSGTVLENLQLVAPDADEVQRAEALRLAQADFLFSLSAGEQTVVGENNTGLSKGQLQRIAVARAILMNRPVFLLDECTSALDEQTEQALLAALHSLGRTGILVTHHAQAAHQLPGVHMMAMEFM